MPQQWGAQVPVDHKGQPAYAPGPSEPYAPQYYPALEQEHPQDMKSAYDGNRFKPKKRVNDPIFLVLFILQFAGFCAVSAVAFKSFIKEMGLGGGVGGTSHSGSSVTLNRHTVYLLLFVMATGLLLSTAYFILTRMFTAAIMHFTLLLTVALNVGVCIYYWIAKYYSGAVVFTIIAIISVMSYWGFRSRIPLAALLVQVVVDITEFHTSVYAVAFGSLFVQMVLTVWYIFAIVATYIRWTPDSPACNNNGEVCSGGKVAGLVFFLTFSYTWTSMTASNVALATLAGGPFGCWYYFGPKGGDLMPKHPTMSSFFRASTLSLGSIAFGTLIVTILEILRGLLNSLRRDAMEDGDPVGACLACCAECFVNCLENLVEYFNRYAYIEIALYGKSYITAAKSTWRIFKDRGVDAVVNDSLVSMTMTWGAYIVGLLCSLFSYLYLRYTHPVYNQDGDYTAPILLFAFFIGTQLHLTLASVIEAGVSTIFVGLAEDPGVLAIRAPALFGMLADRYPQVVEGVPRD